MTTDLIRPSREKYGTAHRTQYRLVDQLANGWVMDRDGARTKVLMDGQMMRWSTSEWISQEFLDRLKAMRDQERRAPMGDSTGCWQKVAEIPVSFLLNRIPADAWDDQKAIGSLLNDPDLRAFRTDGNHRRL
jgi:hypothetical protein